MSDCSANAMKPYQAAMLRVEFAGEEPAWEQPIALCGREITGVLVDGERYERVRECENTAPAYLDFLCSACGFVHYHSEENDSGDGNDWGYCPNCGAKVKGGAE